MRLRPSLSLLAVLGLLGAGLLFAGCGSSSPGSRAPATLAGELSYFPAGAPFVLTLQTDPNSPAIQQAHQLENKFPLAAFGQAALTTKLQQLGINYSADIRPLFGYPVLIGAGGNTLSGAAALNFLIVWTAKDAGKLNALLSKIGARQPVGTRDGAKLYTVGAANLAVAGATLVFGSTPAAVSNALDRHAHGGGITPAQYARETAGLSASSLSQVFGDLSGVLGTATAAKARRVPWVAALRGYGVALNASASGLTMRFHLDTTGRTLTAAQLPFAAGSSAPTLAGAAPIAAGIHDPAQIIAFVEAVAQQTGASRFLSDQAKLRARTGVDLNALAAKLTGDLLVDSDTHVTVGRAAVSDPSGVAADLAKLASDPHDLFGRPASSVRKLPGGFYAIVGPKHKTIYVGVSAGQLLAGNALPAALRDFASAPAAAAPGAQGTVAFRIALQQLLGLTLHRQLPAVVRSVLAQLGAITGWASASPSGIDGSATLAVK
jgi:hypothetical protein